MKTWIALVPALIAAACAAQTTQPASAPTTQPAASTATTQPATATATTAPAADPAVVKILDSLEQSGERYQTIQAEIEWTIENQVLGDKEVRAGWLAYQSEGKDQPVRVRFHFDTLQLNDGPRTRNGEDYTFDGEWAVVAKERIKTMDKYQVAAPGEKVRILDLGKGPLPPLPFGQKTENVLKHFDATTRPLKSGEPAGTEYLRLEVRPEFREDFNFLWVEMWMDPKLQLPLRIAGKERNKNLQTVLLGKFKTNGPLKKETFDLPDFGWKVNIMRYGEK